MHQLFAQRLQAQAYPALHRKFLKQRFAVAIHRAFGHMHLGGNLFVRKLAAGKL